MPSNIAVIRELTADGADLQDWPRIFLELVEGMPWYTPEVRGPGRTVLPYSETSIPRLQRADRLPIRLKGRVQGDGLTEDARRSDTVTAQLEVAAIFDPTRAANDPVVLTATLPDGQVATISARTEAIVWEDDPPDPTTIAVQIRLVAFEPPAWALGPGS